jgi:hypothetical protein
MTIQELLKLKFPDADFMRDIVLFDDGNGAYVKEWNLNTAQPTSKQINDWLNDSSLKVEKDITYTISLLEDLINKKAQERGYDNALSICTYITSTNQQWAAEAKSFIEWRDGVWLKAIQIKDAIVNNERTPPSLEEFFQELPTLIWP